MEWQTSQIGRALGPRTGAPSIASARNTQDGPCRAMLGAPLRFMGLDFRREFRELTRIGSISVRDNSWNSRRKPTREPHAKNAKHAKDLNGLTPSFLATFA